jgi:hypothetical protein
VLEGSFMTNEIHGALEIKTYSTKAWKHLY